MNDTNQATIDSRKSPKPSWRMRWSLRALIAVVSLVCILSAWSAYRIRVGHTHEDVSRQLAETEQFSAWKPGISVQWQYEQTVKRKVPFVVEGHVVVSGPTVVSKKVKGTPDWMEQTGISMMFQRIESIRTRALFPPDKFDELVQQICRLDRIDLLAFGTVNAHQQLSQRDLEAILTNVHVKNLFATYCPLDGGSIPALRRSQLEYLDLSHTRFSDITVKELPTTLTWLDLERTAVTDAGLAGFTRLPHLEHLCLNRTPTSEAAIDQLREAMPWCEIIWEPLRNP